MNKTPGQLAYEAYCETTNWKSAISGAPLPQWPEVKPEIAQAWENAAIATRMPLAKKIYDARHAIKRLLITYRSELLGDWYEETAKDAGLKLDEIGFIKGAYGDPEHWEGPKKLLQAIAEGKD